MYFLCNRNFVTYSRFHAILSEFHALSFVLLYIKWMDGSSLCVRGSVL